MSIQSTYNDKVKSNFSSEAKGLEKVILRGTLGVIDLTDGVNKVFYGKPVATIVRNKNNRPRNPLDLGIIPILDLLTSVDYCDLINYSVSKLPSASKFNPQTQPEDTFGKIKWRFQKTAFDVRLSIDKFYSSYPDTSTEESKKAAYNLIIEVNRYFDAWTSGVRSAIEATEYQTNSDLKQLTDKFPQLKNIGNYVTDKLDYFNRFSDYRQIPNEDYQKLLLSVNKIREYCIIIESLSSPASAISALQLVGAGGRINETIRKIEQSIDPTKAIPTIKRVIEACKIVKNISANIRNLIATGQVIIKIALTIIKVFKILVNFLKALPIPNVFTTVGINTVFSDVVRDIKSRGISTFETRLKQVSLFFSFLITLLDSLLPTLAEVIQKLSLLIASLQACEDSPKDLLKELEDIRDDLKKDYDEFNKFLENKKAKDSTKNRDNTFGDFTIQIVTEQVVEEAVSIRRRYGVALNNRGLVVVQSQPTFASDDQIIIQEVKLLLQSKNVVSEKSSNFTVEELEILNEASSYLYEDDINWENFEEMSFELDDPNNENEDQNNLGLNAFVNKLSGGKKLRRKMRRMMRKNNEKLNSDLSNVDPNNKYSSVLANRTSEFSSTNQSEEESNRRRFIDRRRR